MYWKNFVIKVWPLHYERWYMFFFRLRKCVQGVQPLKLGFFFLNFFFLFAPPPPKKKDVCHAPLPSDYVNDTLIPGSTTTSFSLINTKIINEKIWSIILFTLIINTKCIVLKKLWIPCTCSDSNPELISMKNSKHVLQTIISA